jgi:hypothetical protein
MAGAVGRLLDHRSDGVRQAGELLLNPARPQSSNQA